uniref:helix-turn-helix domain-containing protein n=1 Tax=Natrinema ejinorense TaxID=373386 RepID=UPI001B80D698|nr:helix-turn-helix domain-containing protein [Natrinema ejinorense]
MTDPTGCPLASIGDGADDVRLLSRTIDRSGQRIDLLASERNLSTEHDAISPQFSYGTTTVYRLETDASECVCRSPEHSGVPIERVDVTDDGLCYTIYPSSLEELEDVLSALRLHAESVKLVQLVRDDADLEEEAYRVLDVTRLTDRQREVLRTAYRMGYFSYPRETTAREVAEALDIAPSTVHKHLVAALGSVLESLYGTER